MPALSPPMHRTSHLLAYASLAMGLQAIQATNGTFLAPLLESMGTTPFWISVILSIDPIVCILFMPLMNRWSDRSASRWGRRLPFIVAGVLVAAASLTWIGTATRPQQIALGMVALYVGASAIWGPYRAVLGEIVATDRHTTATGLQGLCQGIGTLAAIGGGGLLLAYGPGWPFLSAATLLLLCSVASIAVIRRTVAQHQAPPVAHESFGTLFRAAPDLPWLLAAQTCWWGAMSGVTAFAVLYVNHEILGIHVGSVASTAGTQQATGILVLFAVVTMLMAIPCGKLASRYGKARVLQGGLLLLMAGMGMALVATDLTMLRAAITFCGMGFAAVQVIPITLFAERQRPGHEGAMMTVLGIFTDGPLIIGYLLEGWLIAQTGSYRVPFAIGPVLCLAAWWCIGNLQTTSPRVAVPDI